jgi:hypothetical protein
VLVGHPPVKGDHRTLDQLRQHLQRQVRLGLKAQVSRDPVALAPGRVGGIGPLLGQGEPPVQERIALAADVHGEHPLLTVGDLAHRPTVLARDAHRVGPWLGKPTPITDHRAVGFAETLRHQALMAREDGSVLPRPLPQKLVPRSDGSQLWSFQRPHPRFNGLPLNIGELPP